MNVRTLCLSILFDREASGYEIRKLCTEDEGCYFVEASFGSIYPALAKLEDDGLVVSRVEQQSGKPNKKIYAITAAGREAFIDALHEPMADDIFRSPFLLFARFAHLVDAELVKSRIEARLAKMDETIADLRRMQNDLATDPCGNGGSYANDAWVLSYGLKTLEAAREHLHTDMNDLIATARHTQRLASAAE